MGLYDQQHSKNFNILKYYCKLKWLFFYFDIFYFIYSFNSKAEFSASLFHSSDDPSEIILIYWFASQEAFLIFISVETSCSA